MEHYNDEGHFSQGNYEFRDPDVEVMQPASPNNFDVEFAYDGEEFRDPIDDEINRIIEENYNPNVEENQAHRPEGHDVRLEEYPHEYDQYSESGANGYAHGLDQDGSKYLENRNIFGAYSDNRHLHPGSRTNRYQGQGSGHSQHGYKHPLYKSGEHSKGHPEPGFNGYATDVPRSGHYDKHDAQNQKIFGLRQQEYVEEDEEYPNNHDFDFEETGANGWSMNGTGAVHVQEEYLEGQEGALHPEHGSIEYPMAGRGAAQNQDISGAYPGGQRLYQGSRFHEHSMAAPGAVHIQEEYPEDQEGPEFNGYYMDDPNALYDRSYSIPAGRPGNSSQSLFHTHPGNQQNPGHPDIRGQSGIDPYMLQNASESPNGQNQYDQNALDPAYLNHNPVSRKHPRLTPYLLTDPPFQRRNSLIPAENRYGHLKFRKPSQPKKRVPEEDAEKPEEDQTTPKRHRGIYPNEVNKIEKWTREPEEIEPFPEEIPKRSTVPVVSLIMYACKNSPDGWVTAVEVYSFVLHHFPCYRFVSFNWRASVRSKLSHRTYFKSEKEGDKQFYGILDEQIVEKWMAKDGNRDEEFHDVFFSGSVGLPRQLFYFIIGNSAPEYAGPENSALFYHMLSIGQIPETFSKLFNMYTGKSTGKEPKFTEVHMAFDRKILRKPEWMTSWEVNGTSELDEKVVEMFQKHINMYFELQEQSKRGGNKNWSTPALETY